MASLPVSISINEFLDTIEHIFKLHIATSGGVGKVSDHQLCSMVSEYIDFFCKSNNLENKYDYHFFQDMLVRLDDIETIENIHFVKDGSNNELNNSYFAYSLILETLKYKRVTEEEVPHN